MKEIRYNEIAFIFVLFISIFILVHPPFVLSIYVPTFIRAGGFLIVVVFPFFTLIFKNYINRIYLRILLFYVASSFYWISIGAVFQEVVYNVLYVLLAIVLIASVRRNKRLKELLISFYFRLVLILSILSVISFLAFNLKLINYELKPVGEGLDVYMHYHNYFLGYINTKYFEYGVIGRVCGFMFEPSYQGWFLCTNFFLLPKWIKNKSHLLTLQLVVLLGALSSFSTMSWLVFAIVFVSIFGFKIMSFVGLKAKVANALYGIMLFVMIFASNTVISQDKLLESLGPSSSEDRTNRLDTSLIYLFSASPTQLLLGRGPGFIVKNSDRGESNPIVKTMVENGLIVTIFVLLFVIYCTYKSKYYMIANLLWLNSVVVLFTPLFIINILICKWLAEREEKL